MARASASDTGRGLRATLWLDCDRRATASRSSSSTPTSDRRPGQADLGRAARSIGAGRVASSPRAAPIRATSSGTASALKRHRVRQEDGVGQAVRDAGAAADELGQAVVDAHAGVQQAAARQGGAGEHGGAGVDVVRVGHDAPGAPSRIVRRPGQGDGLGLGRAVRRVGRLDAVGQRVHARLGAHPGGRGQREVGVVDRDDRRRGGAAGALLLLGGRDRSCRRTGVSSAPE